MIKNKEVVHIAGSDEIKQKIYEFRYHIYVEEMGVNIKAGTEESKIIYDPEDDDENTAIFYIGKDHEITKTIRLQRFAPNSIPEKIIDEYSLHLFPKINSVSTSICSRLLISKEARGGIALISLFLAGYKYCLEHNVTFVFANCYPALVPMYRRIGFRPYPGKVIHIGDGIAVPVLFMLADINFLEKVRSPFLDDAKFLLKKYNIPQITKNPYEHLFLSQEISAEKEKDSLMNLMFDKISLGPNRNKPFLYSLRQESIDELFSSGVLLTVGCDTQIISDNRYEDDLYIVLSGIFDVTVDGKRIAIIREGEVFGELSFFIGSNKRSANIHSLSDGKILQIHSKKLRKIIGRNDSLAVDILLRLTESIASRVLSANAMTVYTNL